MFETYLIYSFGLILCYTLLWIGEGEKYQIINKGNNLNPISVINLSKVKQGNLLIILALTIIVLISGLRDSSVGIDSENYRDYYVKFLNDKESLNAEIIEPGFTLILYFYSIFNSHYSLIFLSAALITWGVFYKIFEGSFLVLPFVILVLFLDGYFFWTMNGMRQAISISIFTFALKYIQEKNFKKYTLAILAASLFHYSSILLISFYFIKNIINGNNQYRKYIFLLLYVIPFVIDVQAYVREITIWFFELIPKYNFYTDKVYEYNAESNTGLGVIFKHCLNLLLIFHANDLKKRFPKFNILIDILLVGLIIYNITYGVQILGRFSTYFSLIRVIGIGLLLSYWYFNRNKFYKILYLLVMTVFIGQFILAINQNANGCSPYTMSLFK